MAHIYVVIDHNNEGHGNQVAFVTPNYKEIMEWARDINYEHDIDSFDIRDYCTEELPVSIGDIKLMAQQIGMKLVPDEKVTKKFTEGHNA